MRAFPVGVGIANICKSAGDPKKKAGNAITDAGLLVKNVQCS